MIRRAFRAERRLIATACRVLAARDLASGFLGHISLRVDEDRFLVRCRGPRERGLAWTVPADIRLVHAAGDPAGPGELDGYSIPNEWPLHAGILRSQTEVSAVVHAHPPAVVAVDLAGLSIRPIVGAFDIPGARLAAGGVPIHPSACLIADQERAAAMVASMGDRPVVLLRGHGLASTGSSVQEAVLRAICVDTIARLSLMITSAGGTLADLSPDDLAGLPDLGPGFTEGVAWRHEVARLGGRPRAVLRWR